MFWNSTWELFRSLWHGGPFKTDRVSPRNNCFITIGKQLETIGKQLKTIGNNCKQLENNWKTIAKQLKTIGNNWKQLETIKNNWKTTGKHLARSFPVIGNNVLKFHLGII